MKKKTLFRPALATLLAIFSSTAAMGQSAATDWMQELKNRITINGYAQAGYAYSDQNGQTSSSYNLKRTLLWGKARITDRWSFLFMHDFNSVVQEFYTDYRITNDKALTVRLGQFKNSLTLENPLSPVQLELIDICSQAVTNHSGCYDPLFGLQYGRDIGLEIYGDLFNDKIHYELALMNGQGINVKDGNSDKDIIAKLEFRPTKELRFVVSGQKGRGHAVGTAEWNPDIQKGDNYRRDRLSAGFEWKSGQYAPAKYKEPRPIRFRAEYLAGKDGEVTSRGAYATTTVPLVSGIDAVASIDYFDRNTDMNYSQTQATAGLQYWFYKNCRIQLQYTRTWSKFQDDYNWLQAQMQVAF